MTFGSSGTGTGMDNSIPEVREREGNWKKPFPQFGNGKGMKKNHSQNSGMGREWKNLFPKFGNGKGMKKIHSQNSGTGREWKNPFPKFGKGNQRPPFLGMTGNGNGNGNNILFTFLDFFLPGSTLKIFSLTLCPKIFSWLPHMYSDSQKKLGQKLNVQFIMMAPYVEVT